MRDNKFTRQMRLFNRLQALGFTLEECESLRRIEMTLHRWAEAECGDSNAHASWAIERDETTGKPFRCVYPHQGKATRTAIPDREAGAKKRFCAILSARDSRMGKRDPVYGYFQSDPSGCALYIVPCSAVPFGVKLDSCYTSGIAVMA